MRPDLSTPASSIWHTRFRWVPMWFAILALIWPLNGTSARQWVARPLALVAAVVAWQLARIARGHTRSARPLRQRWTLSCTLAAIAFLIGGIGASGNGGLYQAIMIFSIGLMPWVMPDEA